MSSLAVSYQASSDPAVAVGEFEAACLALESPHPPSRAAGERVLLAVRESAGCVSLCRQVLGATRDAGTAFQAAAALRCAALRDCARLSPPELHELRGWCAAAALGSQPQPGRQVTAQLLALHAALLKRAWLDAQPDARMAWLEQLAGGCASGGGGGGGGGCLDALTAVVAEFSPATAQPLHLSWAQHSACARSFADAALQRLFALACGCAHAACASADNPAWLAAALSLASACVTWDWSGCRVPGGHGGPSAQQQSQSRDGPAYCDPPVAWRTPLLGSPATPTPPPTSWLPLALRPGEPQREALGLLSVLCGVRGPVFGTPEQQAAHLSACCAALAAALPGAAQSAAQGEEAPLRQCAHGVLALAQCHPPASWAPQELELLAATAHAALRADRAAFSAAAEAAATLLRRSHGAPQGASPHLAQLAAGLFFAAAERALASAARGEAQESESEDEEEGGDPGGGAAQGDPATQALDTLASLARADVGATFPRLAQALQEARGRCSAGALAGATQEQAGCAQEGLTWLLRASAALLADAPEGETPIPPDECCAGAAAAAARGAACPVTLLSRQLLACFLAVQDGALSASPRLMEAMCCAGARWADTWLLACDQDEGDASLAAWGPSGDGVAACAALAGFSCAALSHWAGEVALANRVARLLLPALSRRRRAAQALAAQPAFARLCAAFASGAQPLGSLPPKTHRLLARALAAGGAAGQPDGPSAAAFLSQLMAPSCALVVAAAQQGPQSWLAVGGAEQALLCALEALRGAASATLPRSRDATFALLSDCAGAVEALAGSACVRARPPLVLGCLRLAGASLESQLPFATRQQAGRLARFGLALVTSGAACGALEQATVSCAAERQQRAYEAYQRTKALIALLAHVTSRDVCDLSGEAEDRNDGGGGGGGGGGEAQSDVDVAAVVLQGLHALLPLLHGDALRFPKLARAFFALLAHCCCVHCARVASLPPQPFAQLAQALLQGTESADLDCAAPCLEALEALARHCAAGGTPALADAPAFLAQLQEALLSRLLLHAAAPTDGTADALLPALLAAPAAWEALQGRLAGRLLAPAGAHAAHAQRAAFAHAAQQLTGANGLQPLLDRVNGRRFRANVQQFAATVRGLVRVT